MPYGYAPMGQEQPVDPNEDAARRFARRRLLMGIQGGLGAGVEAGGGFFGNLLRGASGSLGGTLQANQMQHEEERQSIRDAAEQRRYEEQQSRFMEQLGISREHLQLAKDRETRLSQPQPPDAADLPPILRVPKEQWPEYLSRTGDVAKVTNPPESEPLVQVSGPDGPIYVPRSQAIGKKLPRERSLIKGQERTALAFYNRALDSENAIAPLEEKISTMPLPDQFRLRFAPNVAQSSEMQVYRQAQRAFTEARLRKESGAAIPTSEYVNDSKTYFAQPGDTKETIARKRAARQMVLNGLKFSSGQAYEEYYGEPNVAPGREAGNETGDIIWTRDANGKLVRQ